MDYGVAIAVFLVTIAVSVDKAVSVVAGGDSLVISAVVGNAFCKKCFLHITHEVSYIVCYTLSST